MQLPETGYCTLDDNETALRFAGRVPFVYATSYAYFTNDGLLQHLLHGLKYKGKKEIGYYLGRHLGKGIQKRLLSMKEPLPIDMIIPVPLHKAKEAKRGYNQSMLIADAISDVLHIPATDKLLRRTRNTESQTNKSRVERVKNMTEAFEINRKSMLTGKHILLCDDVLTTGATLEACALALMKDKSIKISIATVGIAVS
jgi:ComF family protein